MTDQTSTTALRPALAKLAAEPESLTTRKLWKALTVVERTQALEAALAADEQGVATVRVQSALIKGKKYRPQTVAAMNRKKLATELAPVPVDDTYLIDSALIDFHFAHRRPMMAAFLDHLGIPHEDGRLGENVADHLPTPERLRAAADALAPRFVPDELFTYFLTLLLQDRATWGALGEWMKERGQG